MGQNYSTEIVKAIDEFLTNDDWNYEFDSERGLFRFGLNLSCRMKKCGYVISVNSDDYVLMAVSPISMDPKDRDQVVKIMEFFTRANYGLRNGCFELDLADGEIRYRVYVDCDNVIPPSDVIRNSIHVAARMMSRYSDGLLGIMFGNMDPKDAIDKCEGDLRARAAQQPEEPEEEDEDDDILLEEGELPTDAGKLLEVLAGWVSSQGEGESESAEEASSEESGESASEPAPSGEGAMSFEDFIKSLQDGEAS